MPWLGEVVPVPMKSRTVPLRLTVATAGLLPSATEPLLTETVGSVAGRTWSSTSPKLVMLTKLGEKSATLSNRTVPLGVTPESWPGTSVLRSHWPA